MEILFFAITAAIFVLIGRMSTVIWRTEDQNLREEYIDYWARQREKPTCDVSYDWQKNQRQTRYSAAAKEAIK